MLEQRLVGFDLPVISDLDHAASCNEARPACDDELEKVTRQHQNDDRNIKPRSDPEGFLGGYDEKEHSSSELNAAKQSGGHSGHKQRDTSRTRGQVVCLWALTTGTLGFLTIEQAENRLLLLVFDVDVQHRLAELKGSGAELMLGIGGFWLLVLGPYALGRFLTAQDQAGQRRIAAERDAARRMLRQRNGDASSASCMMLSGTR